MGLLDSVIGALGQGGGGAQNPQAALLSAIVGMLGQGGGGGAGGGLAGMLGGMLGQAGGGAGGGAGGAGGVDFGGLAGLVEKMTQGGMGDIAKSWVSTGQNLPISPDQLSQLLGGDRVGALAGQLGMNQGDLLGQMSQMLPQVVDRLTPQGSIPQGDIGAMLGSGDLGKMLGGLLGR